MAVLHEHGTLKDWRDEVSALIGVEFTDAQAAVLNERVRSSFDTDTRRLNAITSVLKSGRPLKLNLLAEAWIRDAELTTLLLPALRAVFETAR
ncbi:MAG: hypothetical protein ACKVPX_06405 [Myxococcaceae bacterium]